ncbi:L,D-peptidoglycan transpeptidase YkuD, ErfK/YbiS/YcfS/YnhG family [Roseibium suaedae]|uniref:L,D-peptidoglycan transpeptidase YkuD, ErfK/YbiS/YcfS/YnhG family n=1 Tax=Roseibium suaedae TaxID=735517 RepID=A0A1M7MY50_9HYPH|nr:L,D-peptidoglycan transpeptidase YkuD, ErfK/YbiS/YcfS/YnhG family [Roseibium suaedae]
MRKAAERLVVRVRPGQKTKGILQLGPITVPCAIGRSGLTRLKREGDGATPVGRFALLGAYYRADRQARLAGGVPCEPIRPDDGWCDDPRHFRYNRPVTLPFAASHEKMWRDDHLYDIVVVLDCNMAPAVKGRGSAIFFHLARENYTPTEGCVAVAPRHMRLILSRLRRGAVMEISGL